MLYAPRSVFVNGSVGDANQLMRELNRAEEALSRLDQNNVDDGQVTTAMAVAPSASIEASALTHDSSNALLRAAGSGSYTFPTPTENSGWVTLEDGASAVLELEFTTVETTRLHVLGSFQLSIPYQAAVTDYRLSFRLYIDGQPGSGHTTVSTFTSASASQETGVCLREWLVLPPGTHRIRMKGRDWRANVGSAAGVIISDQWIGAIGWTR